MLRFVFEVEFLLEEIGTVMGMVLSSCLYERELGVRFFWVVLLRYIYFCLKIKMIDVIGYGVDFIYFESGDVSRRGVVKNFIFENL